MLDSALITELEARAREDSITQNVVGAVIADGDAVLLLRRPADDFMGGIHELPSGKVDPGERLDAALVREVKEETGLDVDTIGAYLGHFDYASGSGKPTRQFNFAVTVRAVGPVSLTEHDAYLWACRAKNPPVTGAVAAVLSAHASLNVENEGSR